MILCKDRLWFNIMKVFEMAFLGDLRKKQARHLVGMLQIIPLSRLCPTLSLSKAQGVAHEVPVFIPVAAL